MREFAPLRVDLSSIDGGRNRFRRYTLDLDVDLLGEFLVRRTWGRIGARSRAKVERFVAENDARRAYDRHLRRRERHGYQISTLRAARRTRKTASPRDSRQLSLFASGASAA